MFLLIKCNWGYSKQGGVWEESGGRGKAIMISFLSSKYKNKLKVEGVTRIYLTLFIMNEKNDQNFKKIEIYIDHSEVGLRANFLFQYWYNQYQKLTKMEECSLQQDDVGGQIEYKIREGAKMVRKLALVLKNEKCGVGIRVESRQNSEQNSRVYAFYLLVMVTFWAFILFSILKLNSNNLQLISTHFIGSSIFIHIITLITVNNYSLFVINIDQFTFFILILSYVFIIVQMINVYFKGFEPNEQFQGVRCYLAGMVALFVVCNYTIFIFQSFVFVLLYLNLGFQIFKNLDFINKKNCLNFELHLPLLAFNLVYPLALKMDLLKLNIQTNPRHFILILVFYFLQVLVLGLQRALGPRTPFPFLTQIHTHNYYYKIEDLGQLKLKEDEICSICQYQINQLNETRKVMVTQCHHLFHNECLITWMLNKLQCPNCKQKLQQIFI